MDRTFFQACIVAFTALVTACDDEDTRIESYVVPSSNTYADINVSSDDGQSVFITTQLKEGDVNSDTYIDLQGGDRLIASVGERFDTIQINDDLFSSIDHYAANQKVMDRHDTVFSVDFFWMEYVGSSSVWYFTSFDDIDDGDKFYVSYLRDNAHVSAPDSFVTLPASFNITSPTTGSDALYSRATDDMNITWSPANSAATVKLSANVVCGNGGEFTYSADIIDSGAHTIPANTITGLTGACTAAVKVEKTITGAIDSHLGGGGVIRGRQIRSVSVNTTD